ncbi:hypothetical protein [Chondrinema litorale]|uniref:hypothetical protein n=1 Tax=Chondrinema litorale TaxID=2994555 RepID=UPI002543680E|nr:hypothetical protein [Chondrinema litorale]UZR93128.1 hypothetical protein OQ292_14810 [Chondrinema litorale]
MIALKVADTFLDLDEDSKMTLYYRNAFFDFEVRVGNKSLPFDIPASPLNRRAFGFFDLPETMLKGEFSCQLWLFGNPYKTGKLKVTYENKSFKCTFFWGLSSTAPLLKDFKLSELDYSFNFTEYDSGNNWYLARAHLDVGGGSELDIPQDIGVEYTLRVGFEGNEETFEASATLEEGDTLLNLLNNLGLLVADHFSNLNSFAQILAADSSTIRMFISWWDEVEPSKPLVMELEADYGGIIFTAHFYSQSVIKFIDRYEALYFPEMYAHDTGWDDSYMLAMGDREIFRQFRFLNLNQTYFAPLIDLKFIVRLLADAIGFKVEGLEHIQYEAEYYYDPETNSPRYRTPVAAIFPAQHLNFQFAFNLSDILPDISAADFLKKIAAGFGLHLDFDEDFNTLYIYKKEEMMAGDGKDYTNKIRYYQGSHDKFNIEEDGFEIIIGDDTYLVTDTSSATAFTIDTGLISLSKQALTLPDSSSELLETAKLTYEGDLFAYGTEEAGRIDELILVKWYPDNDADGISSQQLYENYYADFLRTRLESNKIMFPAGFDIGDVFSIDENKPFLINHQKYMPTEIRLEVGKSSFVSGEIDCYRIL